MNPHICSTSSSPGSNVNTWLGRLALFVGEQAVPAPPKNLTVDAFEYTAPTKANLRIQWEPSPLPTRHYQLFQELKSGERVLLGVTPQNAYFVRDIERRDDAPVHTLIVRAVGLDGGTGAEAEAQTPLGWSWVEPPSPPPEVGPNVTGQGTATDQYNDSPQTEGPANAFDDDDMTKWLTFNPTAWLQYDLREARSVIAYSITSANDAPSRDPTSWELLGSDDGASWNTLDAQTDVVFQERFEERLFACEQPGAYRYIRLNVTENVGSNELQVAELRLFEAP